MRCTIAAVVAGPMLLASCAGSAQPSLNSYVIDTTSTASASPTSLPVPKIYRLWIGRAPNATSDSIDQIPTITVFSPPSGWSNNTAVVVAPGGAYVSLAGNLEGLEPAIWLTSRGITAFVLTYRVGPTSRLPTPLLDGSRAIRFVRAHAGDFNVDPNRIGMMGFSAGGHLTAMTAMGATMGDPLSIDPINRQSDRPDFLILAYPWLEATHIQTDGSSSYCDFAVRTNGGKCDPGKYAHFSPFRNIASTFPPTFIYHTADDEIVPIGGTVNFYNALTASKIPSELHAFEFGQHGTGLAGTMPALYKWTELLHEWLKKRSLLPRNGK